MKNITLSVDEEVLAAAGGMPQNETPRSTRWSGSTSPISLNTRTALAAPARLRQLSNQSQGRLGKKAWTREDLHDR